MSKTLRSSQRTDKSSVPRTRRSRGAKRAPQLEDASQPSPRGSRDKSVRIGRTCVGKGVFARKRYLATTIIGEILGDVIDDPDYGSRYCMDIGHGCVLEPDAPFRYVNHSCEPNCEFDWFDLVPAGESQSRRHVFLVALREIKPGEELTIDYNWSADTAIPCRCKEPTCRGWIVDPGQLAAVTARQAGLTRRTTRGKRL
jgi:hypothetical protein